MTITVVGSAYGAPATQRLAEQISAFKAGNPLAPVTVVVPTNIAGLATRRALATQGPGIAAVDFLKLFDMAERLAGRAMADDHQRKPLSDSIIRATVRQALSDRPGVFRESAQHPATEQALVRSYHDLRDLSDEQQAKLAEQSERAADVVRICGQVREQLQHQWYDGQDLVDLAAKSLPTESGRAVAAGFGPVIVHLPQRITRPQARLLAALAGVTPMAVLIGLTGDDKADAPVLASARRMGVEPEGLPEIDRPHAERVISTVSTDEEVRVAVREVVNAARGGTPLARIAVLCGGGPTVVRRLHSQLEAAGIVYNGPSGLTLADSLVGRGLGALLHLPGRDFRRDEVFALLSVAQPTVAAPDGSGNGEAAVPAPVMAWERASRDAGVARGADQWQERLGRHAAELRAEAEAATQGDDPDEADLRIQALKRAAGHAESLAEFMAGLITDLSPVPAPDTWSSWSDWVTDLVETYLGDRQSRRRWPEQEQEAATAVLGILSRLRGLDEVEAKPRPSTFRQTLVSELTAATTRIGQVGRGVLTGTIGESLGMELDQVVLLGLSEGEFPHTLHDDPLLPDRERQAAGDDLALLGDRPAEQHRQFLAALASSQGATLIYARGNSRRAAEQHPSRWLLDTATALAGSRVDSTHLESLANDSHAPWFEHVPSFCSRVMHAEFPATVQEFRLQALALGDTPGDSDLGQDPALARGVELMQARASDGFTRFDGNLAGVDLSHTIGTVMSPTSLATWAECPLRYFFRHVLRVATIEQPEDVTEITASEKGSLIHNALDTFLQEQLAQNQVPGPGQPWTEEQRSRLLEIGQELCQEAEDRGITGSPVVWGDRRGRILADLVRFIDEDNDLRRELNTAPVASELAFGMDDSPLDEVAVELPSGRRVRFRGRADRIDQGPDGELVALDYKSGKAEKYTGVNRPKRGSKKEKGWDPVLQGTRLQLPVYGLAARAQAGNPRAPVTTRYWFVNSEEEFKAYGYALDQQVMERFGQAVTTIVEGVDAGVFCDRPREDTMGRYSQHCEYCNADRVGTHDRRWDWDRLRAQPELRDYRDLVEPPDDDPASKEVSP